MKALIQQIESGLYWKTGRGWVKDREEAEGFGNLDAAVLFCVATEMRNTRIVLDFGEPELSRCILSVKQVTNIRAVN